MIDVDHSIAYLMISKQPLYIDYHLYENLPETGTRGAMSWVLVLWAARSWVVLVCSGVVWRLSSSSSSELMLEPYILSTSSQSKQKQKGTPPKTYDGHCAIPQARCEKGDGLSHAQLSPIQNLVVIVESKCSSWHRWCPKLTPPVALVRPG